MKEIIITRGRKKLVARMITYHCIIGYDLVNFEKYLRKKNYPFSKNAMENMNLGSRWQPFKNPPRVFDVDDFKVFLDISGLIKDVQIISIKNGESKIIKAPNNSRTPFFVASFGSSGVTVSNQIYIEDSSMKQHFLIETKNDWKTGHMLSICEK